MPWAPSSSGSRRRCRIGWCNVPRERRGGKCPAANAAATCAAELLPRGPGGRQGGRCRSDVDLSVHPPPVNDFFATLTGQSRDQIRPQVQDYLDANPQVRAELEGIRQPAVDFLNRCGVPGQSVGGVGT